MLISYALYEDYPRINTQIAYIYTCNGYLHMKFNELVSSAVGHSSANGELGDFFLTQSRTSNARLVSSRIEHVYGYIDYRSRGNCYQSRKNLTRSSARVYVYVRVRDDHGARPDRVAVR